MKQLYYAIIISALDFPDYSTGTYSLETAIKIRAALNADYIAVIDESGPDPVCIREIYPADEIKAAAPAGNVL